VQLVNYAILDLFSLFIRLRSEKGQDLLEYAMLGGLIAAAIAVIAVVFSGAIGNMASGISKCIDFDPNTICSGGI
jgi:Flp pilus assembly pilin Flp